MRASVLFMTLVIPLAAVAACNSRSDKLPPAPTAEQIVDGCTLFTDQNSKRMLVFTSSHGVELTELTSAAGADEDILGSKHVQVSSGTFTIDPSTMTVTVNLAGKSTAYTAFSPDTQSCVLVHGSLNDADLTSSWFGEFGSADNEPDDDSQY